MISYLVLRHVAFIPCIIRAKIVFQLLPSPLPQLDKVMHHPWLKSGSMDGMLEPVLPMGDMVQTCPLNTRDEIDPDVLLSMTSLGCFRDKHKLIDALLSPRLVYIWEFIYFEF